MRVHSLNFHSRIVLLKDALASVLPSGLNDIEVTPEELVIVLNNSACFASNVFPLAASSGITRADDEDNDDEGTAKAAESTLTGGIIAFDALGPSPIFFSSRGRSLPLAAAEESAAAAAS
jgi:hypothetical protein